MNSPMSTPTEKRLEKIFGRLPKAVEENLRLLVYNEKENSFVCLSCRTEIKLYDEKGLPKRTCLEAHVLSKKHMQNNYSMEHLEAALKETFLGKIPQIIYNNMIVMDMDDLHYYCKICEKTLLTNQCPSTLEKNYSYHFLSFGHVKNLDIFRKMLHNLEAIYGGIPDIIASNSKFLCCQGKDFLCELCGEVIEVIATNLNETETRFKGHFNSKIHITNAKQDETYSRLRKLGQIFAPLPGYVLRNIEYLSMNGPNFFCSLCNENIKYNEDSSYLTEENFKLHYFSTVHEQNLLIRGDPNNEVFCALQNAYETIPDVALEHIKYIITNEDQFYCKLCSGVMVDDEGVNETVMAHLQCDFHQVTVDEELQRRSEIIEGMKLLFGSIPEMIQDTIEYLEYKGNGNFACVICSENINVESESNEVEVENKFMAHIDSEEHTNQMKALQESSESLEVDIQRLYESIPTFITNNWNHLGYSCNKWEDFYCFLCNCSIPNDHGNKRDEMVLQNFRGHLLSSGHKARLKLKANKEMETTDKLESIFGKIPSFILTNIEHVYKSKDGFYCFICQIHLRDETYPEMLEQYFYRHMSSPCHKSKATDLLQSNERALRRLDKKYSRIPEFLLRNIDHLFVYGTNLYCILCQETLLVDFDFKRTKQSLRCHFYSEKHQKNMKNV